MIVALCVDDNMGLRFNNRRQSRDSAVVRDLMAMGSPVRIHPASWRLFREQEVIQEEDYLTNAREGDICFCENRGYLDYADKIERIILYRWNRDYPEDMRFEFPGEWRLASSADFPGTSHENITREEYVK